MASLEIRIDTAELRLLESEFISRLKALGIEEASRRLGRAIDGDFIETLFDVQFDRATGLCRAVPTAAFDRPLELLWKE